MTQKITSLSNRSQSVLPGGGGGLNPLSRRWSNRNLQFVDNFFHLSRSTASHISGFGGEERAPTVLHIPDIKVFIFLSHHCQDLYLCNPDIKVSFLSHHCQCLYLCIPDIKVFMFLSHHHHHLFLHIRISQTTIQSIFHIFSCSRTCEETRWHHWQLDLATLGWEMKKMNKEDFAVVVYDDDKDVVIFDMMRKMRMRMMTSIKAKLQKKTCRSGRVCSQHQSTQTWRSWRSRWASPCSTSTGFDLPHQILNSFSVFLLSRTPAIVKGNKSF